MPCRIADFLDLVHQLEGVTQTDLDRGDPAVTEALVASILASFRWR